MSEAYLGIDLGTTNSCVCYWNKATQSTETIVNELGKSTTPSWVSFEADGKVTVGERAQHKQNWVYDSKRMIGLSYNNPEIQKLSASWPFEVEQGERERCVIRLPGIDRVQSPEEIASLILASLVSNASKRLQQDVKKCVVTVPAYFNNLQKQATKDACKIAGLDCLRIINEPTAAALACGLDQPDEEQNVLVFDLGGGTFDVSVLFMSEGMIDVLSTRGDMLLGGRDLDEILANHCLQEFLNKTGVDLWQDKTARARLQVVCEIAKKELSVSYEATVRILSFSEGHDLNVEISRATFVQLAKSTFDKIKYPVDKALEDADMSKSEIQKVVLVGGSTRIPWIKEWLTEYFGFAPDDRLNPDEGVAVGAALMARTLSGQETENQLVLQDLTPLTLGVGIVGDRVVKQINRNTSIPCEAEERYCTVHNNQTRIKIKVVQGESDVASLNHQLGAFTYDGIPAAPAGQQSVLVKFKIDVNGLLTVTTTIEADGRVNEETIKPVSMNLSAQEVEDMVIANEFRRGRLEQ